MRARSGGLRVFLVLVLMDCYIWMMQTLKIVYLFMKFRINIIDVQHLNIQLRVYLVDVSFPIVISM